MVDSKKYKLVKGKTGKSKKVVVMGVKKVLYKKVGSQKLYVISKGRMMNLVKYKKMKMADKSVSKKRKARKTKRGGGAENFASISEAFGSSGHKHDDEMAGGKKKKKKKNKKRKGKK
jgi:hypothetical protein